MTTSKYAVWADNSLAPMGEIEEYGWMSDDYMVVDIPDDEDPDEWVTKNNPQGEEK